MTVALDVAAATGRDFPRASNRDLDLRTLADAYMAAYSGRDHSRALYLGHWIDALGARRLSELDGDLVADALEAFRLSPPRTVW